MRAFPLLTYPPLPPGCPQALRWDALNEEWAQRNHSQTLTRLAERGGLSPCEAVANIERRPWRPMRDAAAVAALLPYAFNPC